MQTAAAAGAHPRFVVLDGLRGVAALAVMAHHLTGHTGRPVFGGATLAVDLFFCLSGFVLAQAYQERLRQGLSLRHFVLLRLLRLYPMYAISLALGAVALLAKIAAGQSSYSAGQGLLATACNALYLPWLSDGWVQLSRDRVKGALFPANDPAWSLCFELGVNLVFALLALRLPGRRTLVIVAGAGAAGLVWWVTATGKTGPGWGASNLLGGVPRVVWGFFSGVLLYALHLRLQQRPRRWVPAVPAPLLALVVLALLWRLFSPMGWLLATLVAVPLLVLLGAASPPGGPALTHWCERLGWLSYPVYCLHFPVWLFYTLATRNADTGLVGLAVCGGVTLLIAPLLTRHVEEPLRARLACLSARPPR